MATSRYNQVARAGTTVAAANAYGDIILDGNLGDWSTSYALPVPPGSYAPPPAGSALYGKVVQGAFVFALKTSQLAGTHLLLNTDLDSSTGTNIYGHVNESLQKGLPNNQYVLGSGIDYQISFTAEGIPQLFTGAGVLVGTLPYAVSGDVTEFAVPQSMLANAPQATTVQLEFYDGYYGVAYVPPTSLLTPPLTTGGITIDGTASDWTAASRLDGAGNGVGGYEIYGKSAGDYYVFALKAPIAIGANTTMWINTDDNHQTGYLIWGFAGGAEYNVNFDANGVPHLYTGAAGQTLVSADIRYATSPDGTFVEFAIPKAAIGSPGQIGTYFDINDAVFLPTLYAAGQYTVGNPNLILRPAPDLIAGSDTGISSTDDITKVATATFTGVAAPGDTVELFEGTRSLGSTVARANGSWRIVSAGLSDGAHSVFTTESDLAGNVSAHSAALTVTVDTVAPPAPAFLGVVTSAVAMTLEGLAFAGSQVTVYDGTRAIGTASVSTAGGAMSFVLPSDLSDRVHIFTATASDVAGNTSGRSGSVQLGSSGADKLVSTSGNDVFAGRAGSDTFTFGANFGADAILDFVPSGKDHDVISFRANPVLDSFSKVMQHAAQVGTSVVITQDASSTLTLANAVRSSLTANNFLFG